MIQLISGFFRTILPDPVLIWLRGDTAEGKGSVLGRFFFDPRERLRLWLFERRGGTYLEWYARRLDEFAKDDHVSSLTPTSEGERHRLEYLATGHHDLTLLKRLGFAPHHTLHEIGVGHGRSAQFFVDYLEIGHYSGNDISKERLRIARELFAVKGLSHKNPLLIVNQDNSFDWLNGRKVDFLWANSVFEHTPPEDLEKILVNLHKVMHEGTRFYCAVRGADPNIKLKRPSVKDWVRDHAFWEAVAKRTNYRAELVNVELPRDYKPIDARIMKLTLASCAAATGSAG